MTQRTRTAFDQAPDEAVRMRAAYRMTAGPEGDESLSDFIASAVRAEVERREQQYNNGQPFDPARGGRLRAGRRPNW